ncbi:hypothetical protein NDA16_000650 [Ustilago loliicola]|nr:hypothetical protein NDA16_000650 [Ustilago loliicola]
MSNKRVRGLAIHRPILYGSTSTPLTPAEKLAAPPDHTHKWTVAVRSAASHPLPSLSTISGLPNNAAFEQGSELAAVTAANPAAAAATSATGTPGSAAGATISTRGRDQEHDYHKMAGGKDDITHFIKRVQFKLHDTYPQPTRNIDKAPFQCTESGWGEFEIQIKIFFVPEANEKPTTLFHHLKLHPWLQQVAAVEANEPAAPAIPASMPPADTLFSVEASNADDKTEEAAEESAPAKDETKKESETDGMDVDPAPATSETDGAATNAPADGPTAATAASTATSSAPKPALPPVVHSWQYDEIVFPEPMEPFYDILTMHPPTPLPSSSALAFADPAAYRSYQYLRSEADKGKAPPASQPPIPPHPLHTPTGYLFDALSQEAQQAEADRLDMARIAAIRDLEEGREQLIKAEKALKDARNRIASLNNNALLASAGSGSASSSTAAAPVPPAA